MRITALKKRHIRKEKEWQSILRRVKYRDKSLEKLTARHLLPLCLVLWHNQTCMQCLCHWLGPESCRAQPQPFVPRAYQRQNTSLQWDSRPACKQSMHLCQNLTRALLNGFCWTASYTETYSCRAGPTSIFRLAHSRILKTTGKAEMSIPCDLFSLPSLATFKPQGSSLPLRPLVLSPRLMRPCQNIIFRFLVEVRMSLSSIQVYFMILTEYCRAPRLLSKCKAGQSCPRFFHWS